MGRGRSWGEEDEMRSKWEVTTGLCPNFCAAAELVVPSNLLPGILFPLAAGSVAKGEKGTLAGDGPHRDLNTLPGATWWRASETNTKHKKRELQLPEKNLAELPMSTSVIFTTLT